MATYTITPDPWQQFVDPLTGLPLANGSVTTYAAGTTSLLATYKDNLGTANTNPIALDGFGRCVIFLLVGTGYKYVVADSLGNVQQTQDNIVGVSISSVTVPVTVAQGGTGLTAGTPGGVPAYTATGTIASSGVLTSRAIVLGGGSGIVPLTDSNWLINSAHILSSSTQPRWSAYNSAAQVVATATRTLLTFDTDSTDITNVGAMHSTSVNTSRLTVPTAGDGLYHVVAVIPFAQSAVGATRQGAILKNGTSLNPFTILPVPATGDFCTILVNLYANAVAGDYFECSAYHDVGGNLNIGNGTTSRTQLTAVKFW